MAAGKTHTLAVDENGRLFAWGSNTFGRLGLGDDLPRITPILVDFGKIIHITKISCGDKHSACTTDMGELFVWGSNLNNQLGMPLSFALVNYYNTPKRVRLGSARATNVACGASHTVILVNSENGVMAAGSNECGECGVFGGDGFSLKKFTFVDSKELKLACGVAACRGKTMVWTSNGEVFYIRGKGFKKVGFKDASIFIVKASVSTSAAMYLASDGRAFVHYDKPIQVLRDVKGLVDISMNESHSCAVSENGSLYSWGSPNAIGALGRGECVVGPEKPQRVDGVCNVRGVCAGRDYTMIVVGLKRGLSFLELYHGEELTLKLCAERKMICTVNAFNVISYWEQAYDYGLDRVMDACEGFIRTNYHALSAINPPVIAAFEEMLDLDGAEEEEGNEDDDSDLGEEFDLQFQMTEVNVQRESVKVEEELVVVGNAAAVVVLAVEKQQHLKQLQDLRCELCNVEFLTEPSRVDHFLGKKHRTMERRLFDTVVNSKVKKALSSVKISQKEQRRVHFEQSNRVRQAAEAREAATPVSFSWSFPESSNSIQKNFRDIQREEAKRAASLPKPQSPQLMTTRQETTLPRAARWGGQNNEKVAAAAISPIASPSLRDIIKYQDEYERLSKSPVVVLKTSAWGYISPPPVVEGARRKN